jgi:predicted AlkP superfamily pyrophosphatase or phosphodiesterase
MMRTRSGWLAVAVVVLTLVSRGFASGDPPLRVVMISVDGMMPEYFLKADALSLKIPNLRRLMRDGAYARVNGVLPTVTYPSHTTLITGVLPRRHGIGNNRLFDPEERSNSAWHWYASEVQVPTLVSAARARGLSTGASSWPVSVGAFADYNLPEFYRSGSEHPADLHLLEAISTPGLVAAVEKDRGRPFAYPLTDAERTDTAVHVLKRHRPQLLLLHIFELDHAEHVFGPLTPEAKAAVEESDTHVGEVLAALDALSLRSETLVVIVSDHGFLPVRQAIRPNTLLREAGLLEVGDDGKIARWQAVFQAAGGSSFLHVKEGAPEGVVARVRAALAPHLADPARGIRNVLDAKAIEGFGGIDVPLVLNAREGFTFVDGAAGDLLAPATVKGTHGFAPDRDEMRASLILSGPGVRSRGDLGVVSMTSIAPTVARVLGVTLDPHAGVPLP